MLYFYVTSCLNEFINETGSFDRACSTKTTVFGFSSLTFINYYQSRKLALKNFV